MSWEQIPGWTDENYLALYRRAVQHASSVQPSLFIELGACFGRSAAYMAELIEASGKPIRFVAVDYWICGGWPDPALNALVAQAGGDFMKACSHLLDGNLTANERRHVELLKSDSADAAGCFADRSVDFCFIDAKHEEDGVARDIAAWLPKMRRDRVIAGHDHTPDFPDVERCCRAAFGAPGLGYEVIGTCWWHGT